MKRKTGEMINRALKDSSPLQDKHPDALLTRAAGAALNAQLAKSNEEAELYVTRAIAYLIKYLETEE